MYRRLKDLRTDADMKQAELAAILHCNQRTISDYENGKLDIPTDILIKLAVFYDTSVDYLLELTECKQPYPRSKK